MLFLQGARDALADVTLLNPLVKRLGNRATLCVLQDADHSFRVPARSTTTNSQINDEVLSTLATWVEGATA
jgi:hypothetical protein